MHNFYRKTIASSILTLSVLLVNSKEIEKTAILYDGWSITNNLSTNSTGMSPTYEINRPWNHRILTYFFQNGTDDIAGDNEKQAVRQAFDLWSNQADIVFLEVCSEAVADIRIKWATGYHGDNFTFDGRFNGSSQNFLAHGNPPPLPGSTDPFDGDLHFDDDEDWIDQVRNDNQQPIDLITIAAHEIGHILGLGHTTVPGSLMENKYEGSHRYLGSDDVAGIQSMYGQKGNGTIITGANYFCNSNSLTLQENPNNTTVSWFVSPSFPFSSSNGNGTTANLNYVGQTGAKYDITYNIQSRCGNVSISRHNLWVGNPSLQQMTYGTAGNGQNNTVNTVNILSPSVWYIIRTNTELAQLTYGPNWSTNNLVNGYVSAPGEYRLNLSSGQSVNLTVSASNSCGSATRTITFTAPSSYRVAPNPAHSTIIVQFDETNYIEALPEEIGLYSEKSTNSLKKVTISDLFNSQSFKEQREVEFDVSGFPRGVYYIRIKNNKVEGKEIDAIRVLVE